MTDAAVPIATVLTPECGEHCGAKRHGDHIQAPLYIGHCPCPGCDCPHKSRTVSKASEKRFFE